MKRTPLAAALSALLAAALFAPTPAHAAPRPTTSDNKIQVVQHNTDMGGIGPALGAAKDMGGVDAITFQELCYKHVASLKSAGYSVHWSQQRARTKNGGCLKGNAIASVHPMTNLATVALVPDLAAKGRAFKLLCADLRNTGVSGTTVCTTHLPLDYNDGAAPTGTQNRNAAADQIKAHVEARIAEKRRVVLTGDFNDKPTSSPLSRFYAHNGGTGRFYEGDQTRGCSLCRNMEVTTSNNKKIDYFLASTPGVGKLKGMNKVVDRSRDKSGHFVIRGSVIFRPLG